MQHTFFVEVRITRSGYVSMRVVEDKPGASYLGRMATHEHVVQIYANDVYGPASKLAIFGRVARWLIAEGIIE